MNIFSNFNKQVAIKPTRCVDWELEAPAHGSIECLQSPSSAGGLECEASCDTGFRFTDGEKTKRFQCQENQDWTPARVVPDCVSEVMNYYKS